MLPCCMVRVMTNKQLLSTQYFPHKSSFHIIYEKYHPKFLSFLLSTKIFPRLNQCAFNLSHSLTIMTTINRHVHVCFLEHNNQYENQRCSHKPTHSPFIV